MLKAALIVEIDESAEDGGDDSRRRTYRIAADGRELLRLEALRLERSAQMARDKRVIPALADARPGAKRS